MSPTFQDESLRQTAMLGVQARVVVEAGLLSGIVCPAAPEFTTIALTGDDGTCLILQVPLFHGRPEFIADRPGRCHGRQSERGTGAVRGVQDNVSPTKWAVQQGFDEGNVLYVV